VPGPHQTITEKLDAIKRLTAKGAEYRHARELMPVLGYREWRNFKGAIEQAKIAFGAAGEDATYHQNGCHRYRGRTVNRRLLP